MTRQSFYFAQPNEKQLKSQIDNQEYSSKRELVNDLIRVYLYRITKFGIIQVDKSFDLALENER